LKIAIITPILYDATSPFNHLMKDILTGFLEAGHEVTRIVAVKSKDDTDYKMGLDGIEYIPVVRDSAPHGNIIKRYSLDTLAEQKMARMLKKVNADVLFEDVSYSSAWAVRAAKRNKIKIVSMLQDIWPDNAVQSGLIAKESPIYKYFESLQKPVYKLSDRFICISPDMKDFIESKGVAGEKIEVIYNWGYDDKPVDIKWEENEFAATNKLSPDKFYAVYAGNIGRMQNVELIVRAASRLKDRKDIQFLIIGDGARRKKIAEQVKGMENVTMLPLQPSSLATSIYSAADVNIIPLVPEGIKTALPSKTGVCLSCGRPVIYCVDKDCEFSKDIEGYGAGYVVSPSDEAELAEKIKKLADAKKAGGNSTCEGAWKLFEEKFTRSKNISEYVRVIEHVIG